MKKQNFVSLAVGSAFAAAALSPLAHAGENPFGATKLQAGYQLAEADTKMKDGSCGGDKKMEGKCGGDKKAAEAKCGADKKMDAKCGAKKKAAEGKCGGDKKMDAACGAKK
ncbi:hypothetical protein [Dechloromonas sp. HYN0024]|uniref:hypothetical protein n=1 Tax=Dechloromonas sp. HYN0024 TaxID=2231055 RepID=UPI000E4338C1|nr:hypothetical protein [Dechloromonas sp. HYN0024]AXS79311.1 hypothetical protein HYN24_04270 [Dechloromonas sp. HYN0024]